jgi:hypothetical protein
VGSKTFDGVWFLVYSHDHPPAHVHGRYGEVRVILDLLPGRKVQLSDRWDAIRPANAKRGDVRRILDVAAAHAVELMELWERTHGAS